ncbi:unnamed protein product [Echinostoma caproni]|uniref:PRM1A n=1 Tax=Echinostoma caproni TaxID=27848 RepID=A0A183A8V7_9TREM|nr:unnamed protein product [Echinostoma caproni]
MTSSLQTWLIKTFDTFAHGLASSYTAGIYNYLFVPTKNESTEETTLKLTTLDLSTILNALKDLLISSVQSVTVWATLPEDSQFGPVKQNIYWLLILLCLLVILIGLGYTCTVIIYPFVRGKHCQCRKKHDLDRLALPFRRNRCCQTNSGAAYLSLGITCALLLMVLFSICTFAFYALGALASPGGSAISNRVKNNTGTVSNGSKNSSSLSESLGFIVDEVRLFLEDVVPIGQNATNQTVNEVVKVLEKNLINLVQEILDHLLVSYGVQTLIDNAKHLIQNVSTLQETTYFINDKSAIVLADVNAFQGAMKGYQNALRDAFDSLCLTLTNSLDHLKCLSLRNQISVLDVKFNSSAILTEPSVVLSELTTIFGINMTAIVNDLNQLQTELNKKSQVIQERLSEKFDVNELFEPVQKLWITLAQKLQPTIQDLTTTSTKVKQTTSIGLIILFTIGYIVLVLCLLLLSSLTVYIALYGTECFERSFFKGTRTVLSSEAFNQDAQQNDAPNTYPPPRCSAKYLIASMIASAVFFFLLLIVCIVIVIFSVVAVNDACRYAITPRGQNQTDAVLNLYLKTLWPDLISNVQLSPDVESLVLLQVPQNVFQALTIYCPSTSETGGNTTDGLLSLVGLNNVVNVTAVLESSSIQNVINDGEDQLVMEILTVNFSSYLPKHLDELFATIENITYYLDSADYTETIKQLKTDPLDVNTATEYTQSLKTFAEPYSEKYADARTIVNTADAIQHQLQTMNSLKQEAHELAQAYEKLQQLRTLTSQLMSIQSDLATVETVRFLLPG